MADKILEIGISMSRYLMAALVLIIIAGCLYSLLGRRYTHRCTAYLKEKGNGKKLPLARWENSVGRSTSCDISLPVGTVSRFHAVIARHSDGWTVVDTHSKTGTYVNGEKVEKRTALHNGNTVAFGSAIFTFVHDDFDKAPEYISALLDEATERAYCLQCEEAIIGRAKESDIELPYSAVSRSHARVFTQDGRWFVEDLGSTTGTTVNARKIKGKARLTDGCVVGVGGIVLVFNEKYKEI